jgi:hypothetical protein
MKTKLKYFILKFWGFRRYRDQNHIYKNNIKQKMRVSHVNPWQRQSQHQMADPYAPDSAVAPLLHPELDQKLDKLEEGIAKNLYVDSTNRRIAGAIIVALSIVGFIVMAVKAESGGVCPQSLSAVLCFGIYAIFGVFLLIGLFVACGLIGLFSGVVCCDLCTQCGQMFACCLIATE